MINVISKRCDFQGCSKHPSYGVAGSKKAEFCVAHAQEGMVDVCSKRCGHPGCTKRSSYGTPGSKKPQFCIHHAMKGMIDVVSKRCAEVGCNKWPSYGIPGSKKAEFCAAHAKDGMVGVCNKASSRSVRRGTLRRGDFRRPVHVFRFRFVFLLSLLAFVSSFPLGAGRGGEKRPVWPHVILSLAEENSLL